VSNSAGSVTSNAATLTVNAQRFTLTVTVQRILVGTGTVDGPGISCGVGATCSVSYNSGTEVTLTARPALALGSVFVSWGGACSGILVPSCTVSMTANRSVTATFGP
jgi:hypothetical protein